MDRLPDPNRPLTVSVLRAALEELEADGYGDTPISTHAGAAPHRLIQAHNISSDRSIADRNQAAALAFCSSWDTTQQGDSTTNFVIL